MTDFTDDELVSAVLDGEATDEEANRVRTDAALSARLAELHAARDAVASSVLLPTAAQRDAAIAAAVSSERAVRLAVDLQERRRRRTLQVASIAAAVLAVLGIVGAIALSNRDGRKAGSTAAGPAPSSSAASALPSPAQPGPSAADEAKNAAAGQGGLAQLGSFQTPQALADAVKAQMPPPMNLAQAAAPPSLAPADGCGPRNNVTYVARASLAGQPVLVIVSGPAGQQTIDVVDLDCTVVFTRPL